MRIIDCDQRTRRKRFTAAQLMELFIADIYSGRLVWKNVSKYHRNLNGREAGKFQRHSRYPEKGYWIVSIDGVAYKRANIIFCIATGKWPKMLDHIDGNGLNDSIHNLRPANALQNAWNHPAPRKKSTLPLGVRKNKYGVPFVARIGYRGKQIQIGCFPTPEEAHAAYIQKRKELFGAYCGL